MPQAQIDILMELWAASLLLANNGDSSHSPPFANHEDLHHVIDSTELGDVPWESLSVQYQGERPADAPEWMDEKYEVWYRDPRKIVHNMLDNPDLHGEIHYASFRDYDEFEEREYMDFMSANFSWEQSVRMFPLLSTLHLSYTYIGPYR
jgi:hypothetical protein